MPLGIALLAVAVAQPVSVSLEGGVGSGLGSTRPELGWVATGNGARVIVNALGTFEVSRGGIARAGDGCAYCLPWGEFVDDDPTTLLATVDGHIVDMLAPGQPVIVPDNHLLTFHAHDIDGDGRRDLIADDVVLLRSDGPVRTPYPSGYPYDDHYPLTGVPIADITGDGRGEFFDADTPATAYPDIAIDPVLASLYPGGPDGYASDPLWTLVFYDVAGSPVPLQADGDPELELALVVARLEFFAYPTGGGRDSRIVIVDDVHTSSPTVSEGPTTALQISRYALQTAKMFRLEDLDGDGGDELLLVAWDVPWPKGEEPDFYVLSSALDYDIDQPLAHFMMEHSSGGAHSDYLNALVVDVDGDGHLDLVGTQANSRDMMQVWFGPLYEPPEPTGPTGDTGTRLATGTTADTAFDPTADTGRSGATGDSEPGSAGGTQAPEKGGSSGDATGCGCTTGAAAGGWWWLAAWLLWRRRSAQRGGLTTAER